MKDAKFTLTLFALFIFSFFSASGQYNALNNRVMQPGDPNLDPLWDWTVDSYYQLYGLNAAGGIVDYGYHRLPFFTLEGEIAELNIGDQPDNYRDFRKSDGWVLLHRDFGTPTSAPNVIHYTLYNKYTGILRLFYWNNILQGNLLGLVKMYFLSTTPKTSNLAHNSDTQVFEYGDPSFVYDQLITVSALSTNGQSSQVQNVPSWCYADFDVSAFDENLSTKTNATFMFSIEGIQESQLKLKSDIELAGQLSTGTMSINDSPYSPLQRVMAYAGTVNDGYLKAKKWLKNSEKTAIKLGQLAIPDPDPNRAWYINKAAIANALPGATRQYKFIKFAASAAGFVKGLIGGWPNNATVLPTTYRMELHGEMNTTGTITLNVSGASFGFRVPGTPHSDAIGDANRPLNDEPLGIVAFRSRPVVEYYAWEGGYDPNTCTYEPEVGATYCYYPDLGLRMALKDPVDLGFNTGKINVVSVNIAFVNDWGPMGLYSSSNILNQSYFPNSALPQYSFYVSARSAGGWMTTGEYESYMNAVEMQLPNSLSVIVRYLPVGRTGNDTLTFMKVIPIDLRQSSATPKTVYNLEASISGPTSVLSGSNSTWAASVLGTGGGYSYRWLKDGVQIGNGQSISLSSSTNFILTLEVTDQFGVSTNSSKSITVQAPQTVSIYGPSWVQKGKSGTWSASVSGGVAPYTYKWKINSTVVGTASSLTRTVNSNFTLVLEVTGANGVMVSSSRNILTGTEPAKIITGIPEEFELKGNFPNPFNPTTTIQYGLSENTRVMLRIYNLLGQEIRTLVNETQSAGYKSVLWDGRDNSGQIVPSGIYIYKLEAGKFKSSKKMSLVK